MTDFDARLRHGLERCGIRLNPGARDTDVAFLEHKLGVNIAPKLRAVYMSFDGFELMEPLSKLRLWSIQEIIESVDDPDYPTPPDQHGIGDYLINSDIITTDLRFQKSLHCIFCLKGDRLHRQSTTC